MSGEGRPWFLGWSQDKKWLVYNADMACGLDSCGPRGPLLRTNVSGRIVQKLEPGYDNFSERFDRTRSHDGVWFAYLNNNGRLYKRRSDGTNPQLLAHLPQFLLTDHQENVFWTPDDEWIYMAINSYYQTANGYRLPSEIFRVKSDGTHFERLVSIKDTSLKSFYASNEWVVFSVANSDSQTGTLYQMRLDGANLEAILDLNSVMLEWTYWVTDTGDALAWEDWYSGNTLWKIDIENAEIRALVGESGISLLHTTTRPIWTATHEWLYLVMVDAGQEYYWVVVDGAGRTLLMLPIMYCADSSVRPFASGDALYFLDGMRGDSCRLLRFDLPDGQPSVVRQFPDGATRFTFPFIADPAWIQYDLNGITYLTTLDGSRTFPMQSYGEGEIVAWVEIPLSEHDTRLAVIIGMGCFGVTLLGGRIFRRR
jgi:hypothetical protein